MAKKTFIQQFAEKHFTNSPAHRLRSVKFGEFLYKYFLPDAEMPKDPATLLTVTRQVMLANEQHLSEDGFVRMMLNQFNNDPSLITFDMVADLMESDAYKKFGTKTGVYAQTYRSDRELKQNFEHWLLNNSMLSKIDAVFEGDVVLNQDGIKRVTTVLSNGQNANYIKEINNKIDAKVKDFNTVFVDNVDIDGFDRLLANNQDDNQEFSDKIKNVYQVLGGQQFGDDLCARFDAVTLGQDSKTRNALLEGETLYLNKVLLGVAQQKGWSNEQVENILVKTPVVRRAEKFAPKEQKGFHPVLDVVKTFGLTLGGATAISAVSSIPCVGSVVGPLLGLTTVIGAGTGAFLKSLGDCKAKAAANGEKLKKTDAAKIALKTGIAMMGKALPYAAAMVLGPKFRAVGASIVMAQTMLNDLDRRADLQREAVEEYEVQNGKSKNIFTRIGNVVRAVKEKHLKGSDFGYAFAYGLGKGAAVYLGGQIGRDLGTAIGHSVEPVQLKDNLANSKMGKIVSSFKGLHKEAESTANIEDAGNDVTELKDNSNKFTKIHVAGLNDDNTNNTNLHANQLSQQDLDRLSRFGHVDLTEHARATVDVNNHRQYVNGVQNDWYTIDEQQRAIENLRNLGLEDPEGWIRKFGSGMRFEKAGEIKNHGFSETLQHIIDNKVDSHDVDNFVKVDAMINREGGLGSAYTITNTHTSSIQAPMYEGSLDTPKVSLTEKTVILPPESINYHPRDVEISSNENSINDNMLTYDNSVVPDVPNVETAVILPPESLNYHLDNSQYASSQESGSYDIASSVVDSTIGASTYTSNSNSVVVPSFEGAGTLDSDASVLIPRFESAGKSGSSVIMPSFTPVADDSLLDENGIYNPFNKSLEDLHIRQR